MPNVSDGDAAQQQGTTTPPQASHRQLPKKQRGKFLSSNFVTVCSSKIDGMFECLGVLWRCTVTVCTELNTLRR